MPQSQVNTTVFTILINHTSRKTAVTFKQLATNPLLRNATQFQIRTAIKLLRTIFIPISSRPNVGYYLDNTLIEMQGLKVWVEKFRKSRHIAPVTPTCLSWV